MPILANIGVPMILIHWPLMVCALVPVIILEALLIRRWVSLSARDALIGIAKANVFSTLVGVPLAWLAMFALDVAVMLPAGRIAVMLEELKWEFDSPVLRVLGFFLSAAWLAPAEAYLHWMIPAAVGILLVPCFFLSVLLERRSCLRTWANADPLRVRRGVFAANVASYALLFLLACGWVTFELATKGPKVQVDRVRAKQIAPQNDGPTMPSSIFDPPGGGRHQ